MCCNRLGPAAHEGAGWLAPAGAVGGATGRLRHPSAAGAAPSQRQHPQRAAAAARAAALRKTGPRARPAAEAGVVGVAPRHRGAHGADGWPAVHVAVLVLQVPQQVGARHMALVAERAREGAAVRCRGGGRGPRRAGRDRLFDGALAQTLQRGAHVRVPSRVEQWHLLAAGALHTDGLSLGTIRDRPRHGTGWDLGAAHGARAAVLGARRLEVRRKAVGAEAVSTRQLHRLGLHIHAHGTQVVLEAVLALEAFVRDDGVWCGAFLAGAGHLVRLHSWVTRPRPKRARALLTHTRVIISGCVPRWETWSQIMPTQLCLPAERVLFARRVAAYRARVMSCRRKASAATSAPSPSATTADVGDRELSAAAQTRVEKKASKPAAGGAAAPAFPVVLFSGIFLFFLAGLYLTIKYS